jgi:hypothetical protein
MASKVKDTPILRGKDAERFNSKMREANKNTIPKTEYERMMNIFNSVRIIETQ